MRVRRSDPCVIVGIADSFNEASEIIPQKRARTPGPRFAFASVGLFGGVGDGATEDAEARAVVAESDQIRKQTANGITITITDKSRSALPPEIGALRYVGRYRMRTPAQPRQTPSAPRGEIAICAAQTPPNLAPQQRSAGVVGSGTRLRRPSTMGYSC
jgi:hypothetical protein